MTALLEELAAVRRELNQTKERMLDIEDELRHRESHQDLLENFCFGLEQEHEKARRLMEAMKAEQDDILATVSQGICTFNRDGHINAECSAKMREIFGAGVADSSIFDLLHLGRELRKRAVKHVDALFTARWMDDRTLARLNPLKELELVRPGVDEVRSLAFTFSRIGTPVSKVLCVVDDRTVERRLNQELQLKADETAQKLEKMYRILMLPRDTFGAFVEETEESLDLINREMREMRSLVEEADRAPLFIRCMRAFHSIKGNARALGLDSIAEAAHGCEASLEVAVDASPENLSHATKAILSHVHRLSGELKDGTNLFAKISDMSATLEERSRHRLDEIESILRNAIEIDALRAGRAVQLEYANGVAHTVPIHVLAKVRTALVQLVRNAVAHGIESEEERCRLGKPVIGTVSVTFSMAEKTLIVACRDDGRGIDRAAVCRAAVARGHSKLVIERLSPDEQLALVFVPGLSTAEESSMLAGRGIGMDVVRDNVRSVGGHVEIRSEPHRFTELMLKLPLSQRTVERKGAVA